MRVFGALAVVAGLVVGSTAANATIIINQGPGNVQGDENVLYNEPGLITSGPLVEGITNQTDTRVDLFGAGEDLFTPSVGQARVAAEDGAFTDLSIALSEGGTFTSVIFNLNAIDDGSVTFTVEQLVGDALVETFSLDGNGQNFFITTAIDGQQITQITIDSTVDIADIRQVRIGFEEGVSVAEPGTLALLGAGLAGLGLLRRRRGKTA